MFDVYLYKGDELPQEGNYYILAENGTFIHKDLGIFRAIVPVKSISFLESFTESPKIVSNLPLIPARYTFQIKEFFRKVVEKHSSEAIVLVYYNKETKEFLLDAPVQEVSHAACRYDGRVYPSYSLIGTIHSHCDFGAFHSGVDDHDEQFKDGLHCTFGHNNREQFTISASFVVNGHRFAINPLEIFEGVVSEGQFYRLSQEPDPSWFEKIDVWEGRVVSFTSCQEIQKGDYVNWASQLNGLMLQTHCGTGPFLVSSIDDQNVVIECEIGKARFSKKLLRKVSHGQEV